MTSLRFLPEAAREAHRAADWYDDQRPGLGTEFTSALMDRARLAGSMPGAGRPERDCPERFELKWYDLRPFPYALLIGSARGNRVVLAVAHERRRPGY